VGWLEGIRRIYKPLRWLLVGFLLLLVAVPLLQQCVLGILQGKSCKWQPTWSFFTANYLWVVPLLVLLVGLLIISWRAAIYYQTRQRQQERLQQARQRFELLTPVSELSPEDLNFRVIGPEEDTPQYGRPFNETVYVSRTAAPYDQRGAKNPQPPYDEASLIRSLQASTDFNGFLLIGPPLDGKSRTLYEIAKRMAGCLIVRPDPYKEVPNDQDFSLLLKDQKVIVLLDDLTKYAQEDTLNLRAFVERLREHASWWAVASTCRDGSDLGSVKDSVKQSLRWFYDNIPLKLFLMEASSEDKRLLAESVGKGRDAHSWGEFPSLGQIVMEEPMRDMKTRFERLSYEQQDILRGLKLLADAGIPTFRLDRLKAVLENESLFERQGIHLGDQLRLLVEQSFLQSVSSDRIQPEPAYLRYVVTFALGRTALEYFEPLMNALKSMGDYEGLFSLGITYYSSYAQYKEALTACDAALEIKPDYAEAHRMRGNLLIEELHNLPSRPFDKAIIKSHGAAAIESFDAALKIKPDYTEVLNDKGSVLSRLFGKHKEALKAYETAIETDPDNLQLLRNVNYELVQLSQGERLLLSQGERLTLYVRMKPLYEQALAVREKKLGEEHLDLASILGDLAVISWWSGTYEEARTHCERALALREKVFGEQHFFERYDEYLWAYAKTLKLDPENYEAWTRRVEAMLGLMKCDILSDVLSENVDTMNYVEDVLTEVVSEYASEEWDLDTLATELNSFYPTTVDFKALDVEKLMSKEILEIVLEDARKRLEERKAEWEERTAELARHGLARTDGLDSFEEAERRTLLPNVDSSRQNLYNLYGMDFLQPRKGERVLSRMDALLEYQREGVHIVRELERYLKEGYVAFIYRIENIKLSEEEMQQLSYGEHHAE
jgi:tetratricopeptide (TPR) repeat protein